MNALYRVIGISKQNFHQRLDRQLERQSYREQLLLIIYELRNDHPTMGCRDMYYKLQPSMLGRDAFEQFCKDEGLMISRPKNWRRTTDSTGVKRFPNLIAEIKLTSINQLWQSDITYFELNGKFYYLTFIEDAYSRRIIGHQTSRSLRTEHTTLPALNMAIKTRQEQGLEGLIFHSDGGGQYFDIEFLKLTSKFNIKNSMCEYPWENGKAERLNGVIKNNYLAHRRIETFDHLVREVDRSIHLYNNDKPHKSLKRKSPIEYENADIVLPKKLMKGEPF